MRRECGSEAGGCGNAAGSAAMRRGCGNEMGGAAMRREGAVMRREVRQ